MVQLTEVEMKTTACLYIIPLLLAGICFGTCFADEADFLFDPPDIWRLELTFTQPDWFDSLMYYYEDEIYMHGVCSLAGEAMDSVGVRFKGNSSFHGYPGPKKSMKIKFNHYDDGLRPFGLTTLNFNNAFKDPTFLREKLFLDFLGEERFDVSRANFAEVYINGEYWGLYIMSETVNKSFITSRFGENEDGDMWKGDPHGTLEWLGPDPVLYQQKYEKANNEEEGDWSQLIEFIYVLNHNDPDTLARILPGYIDCGEFARAMAAGNLFVNLDSYQGTGHNYYIYHIEGRDRFYYITWDVNEAFGNFDFGMQPQEVIDLRWDWLPDGHGTRPLVEAILDAAPFRWIYLEALKDFTAYRFEQSRFDVEIDSYADLIRPSVYADTKKMYSNDQFEENLENDIFAPPHGTIIGLKRFVDDRRTAVSEQLAEFTFLDVVVINELLADNVNGLEDEALENEDWIEIKNISASPLNLGGCWLSDDLGEKTKWQFPDTTVEAGGYIVVFCDDEPLEGPLHATFQLDSGGEEVVFTFLDGETVIDYISFGEQEADISFGRFPDGVPDWRAMHPTPGEENSSNTPPSISDLARLPEWPEPWEDVTVTAHVVDDGAVESVRLYYDAGSGFTELQMFDDGLHGDGAPDDDTYGNTIPGQEDGTIVLYYVSAFDNEGVNRKEPVGAPDDAYGYQVGGTVPLLLINEFMASNDTTIADPQGEFDDWIEIYNGGEDTVYLAGMYLTDDLSDPDKWEFPDIFITPGGFLLVWADGDAGDPGLHTNFKLSASGEQIGLYDISGGVPIDTLSFGVQTTEVSYGREADGGETWTFFTEPTPGSSNNPTAPVAIGVENTPSSVPAGSIASWRITLANNTGEVQVVDVWLSITSDVLPPGLNPYVVLLAEDIAVPPFYQGRGTASLDVPGAAPPGTYAVENIVGTYPGDTWDSVSFDCDVIQP